MNVSVVQFKITYQDPETNFARIESFIAQAKEQHADVIVFPEDCITGSIFGDLTKLDRDGSVRSRFQELAKKHSLDIVTGSCMEETRDGNFNTSYYIDATGTVLGTYRKNHLYPSEHTFLSPGTEAPVFETKFGRAGIVICWDMLFPEIFERMKRRGVQIVYCPSYWYDEIAESMLALNPECEREQMDAMCITRALENTIALVYCNAAGTMSYAKGSPDTLIGHSQITMPVLGAVTRMHHNDEMMIVQSIDLSPLDQAAKIYQK